MDVQKTMNLVKNEIKNKFWMWAGNGIHNGVNHTLVDKIWWHVLLATVKYQVRNPIKVCLNEKQ